MLESLNVSKAIRDSIEQWLQPEFDATVRKEVEQLVEQGNSPGLEDAFYRKLAFGTGGMRGIMGAGTNRMNKYTVGAATQGLANYLKQEFPSETMHVAIAHDSRNNSRFFAEVTAAILSNNGIHAHLFPDLRPAPELSFAVRHLKCHAGIVLTASHNPKEYNGYKVYWQDGGQIVPPHDKGIVEEVNKVEDYLSLKFEAQEDFIHSIDESVDKAYHESILAQMHKVSGLGDALDIPIVFTAIHGTAAVSMPPVLEKAGFTNVQYVQEQMKADGNFPTVEYPNPEESAALDMALQQAEQSSAELVLGTDPDGDRVGIAIRGEEGNLTLLNGNQTSSLLFQYVLESAKQEGQLPENGFLVKTIVTTDLLAAVAEDYNLEMIDTLTGFKFIAEQIRLKEGEKKFIVGGEESYGYLIGDYTRDKDAIGSAALICEMAAYYKSKGIKLIDKLKELYETYGLYVERLVSLKKEGKAGAEEIQEMMKNFRSKSPAKLGDSLVAEVLDYQSSERKKLSDGTTASIDLPKSNVLQFIAEDGTKVSLRPSGTEPKIKFYFSQKQKFSLDVPLREQIREAEKQIEAIQEQLAIPT